MSKKVVLFSGSVPAGTSVCLCSKLITTPFVVESCAVRFALNTNALLRVSFFSSDDNDTGVLSEPNGANILSELGQSAYLVGDDGEVKVESHWETPYSQSYLKVFAVNTDAFVHTLFAAITISGEEV